MEAKHDNIIEPITKPMPLMVSSVDNSSSLQCGGLKNRNLTCMNAVVAPSNSAMADHCWPLYRCPSRSQDIMTVVGRFTWAITLRLPASKTFSACIMTTCAAEKRAATGNACTHRPTSKHIQNPCLPSNRMASDKPKLMERRFLTHTIAAALVWLSATVAQATASPFDASSATKRLISPATRSNLGLSSLPVTAFRLPTTLRSEEDTGRTSIGAVTSSNNPGTRLSDCFRKSPLAPDSLVPSFGLSCAR
mmetsp:Transcript_32122/g.73488  ORF Transcript_32122/g.73488 Transcript_32122/m.73488 type:complete len:249 (+) Transcript_32122:1795-2541(+)